MSSHDHIHRLSSRKSLVNTNENKFLGSNRDGNSIGIFGSQPHYSYDNKDLQSLIKLTRSPESHHVNANKSGVNPNATLNDKSIAGYERSMDYTKGHNELMRLQNENLREHMVEQE
jgi:hypothetical protein